MASVLVTCGVLDSEEFGDESGGKEDDGAADGIDGRYVEKVLDIDESVFLGWVFSLLENFRRCILILIFFKERQRTSLLLHKN